MFYLIGFLVLCLVCHWAEKRYKQIIREQRRKDLFWEIHREEKLRRHGY